MIARGGRGNKDLVSRVFCPPRPDESIILFAPPSPGDPTPTNVSRRQTARLCPSSWSRCRRCSRPSNPARALGPSLVPPAAPGLAAWEVLLWLMLRLLSRGFHVPSSNKQQPLSDGRYASTEAPSLASAPCDDNCLTGRSRLPSPCPPCACCGHECHLGQAHCRRRAKSKRQVGWPPVDSLPGPPPPLMAYERTVYSWTFPPSP